MLTSAETHRGVPGIRSAPPATVERATAEGRRLVGCASVLSHLSTGARLARASIKAG